MAIVRPMRDALTRRGAVLTCTTIAALAAPQAPAVAAGRACSPVVNPYPGSRYEGVDLSNIRATGVSCRTARSVAKGAHARALGLTPPESGIRRFTWNGWRVRGDLTGASDRYVATRGSRRVTWRF